METANEIRNAVNNIRYYSKQINELAKKQFGRDFDIGVVVGIQTVPGSLRFDCLGAIGAATHWIETYCNNIEANIGQAEKLDNELRPPIEKGSEEYGGETVTPEQFR